MIKLIKAKPFGCVPAVLETVLQYYGYTHLTQDDIAGQFSINNDSSTDEKTWGIVMYHGMLNNFFCENKINLVESYISIRVLFDEYDMLDVIKKKLETSIIVCGYNYSALYGDGRSDFGHVSIIESVHDNMVYILDPGPKDYGGKYVKAEQLYFAIKRALDGLWCISPRDTLIV